MDALRVQLSSKQPNFHACLAELDATPSPPLEASSLLLQVVATPGLNQDDQSKAYNILNRLVDKGAQIPPIAELLSDERYLLLLAKTRQIRLLTKAFHDPALPISTAFHVLASSLHDVELTNALLATPAADIARGLATADAAQHAMMLVKTLMQHGVGREYLNGKLNLDHVETRLHLVDCLALDVESNYGWLESIFVKDASNLVAYHALEVIEGVALEKHTNAILSRLESTLVNSGSSDAEVIHMCRALGSLGAFHDAAEQVALRTGNSIALTIESFSAFVLTHPSAMLDTDEAAMELAWRLFLEGKSLVSDMVAALERMARLGGNRCGLFVLKCLAVLHVSGEIMLRMWSDLFHHLQHDVRQRAVIWSALRCLLNNDTYYYPALAMVMSDAGHLMQPGDLEEVESGNERKRVLACHSPDAWEQVAREVLHHALGNVGDWDLFCKGGEGELAEAAAMWLGDYIVFEEENDHDNADQSNDRHWPLHLHHLFLQYAPSPRHVNLSLYIPMTDLFRTALYLGLLTSGLSGHDAVARVAALRSLGMMGGKDKDGFVQYVLRLLTGPLLGLGVAGAVREYLFDGIAPTTTAVVAESTIPIASTSIPIASTSIPIASTSSIPDPVAEARRQWNEAKGHAKEDIVVQQPSFHAASQPPPATSFSSSQNEPSRDDVVVQPEQPPRASSSSRGEQPPSAISPSWTPSFDNAQASQPEQQPRASLSSRAPSQPQPVSSLSSSLYSNQPSAAVPLFNDRAAMHDESRAAVPLFNDRAAMHDEPRAAAPPWTPSFEDPNQPRASLSSNRAPYQPQAVSSRTNDAAFSIRANEQLSRVDAPALIAKDRVASAAQPDQPPRASLSTLAATPVPRASSTTTLHPDQAAASSSAFADSQAAFGAPRAANQSSWTPSFEDARAVQPDQPHRASSSSRADQISRGDAPASVMGNDRALQPDQPRALSTLRANQPSLADAPSWTPSFDDEKATIPHQPSPRAASQPPAVTTSSSSTLQPSNDHVSSSWTPSFDEERTTIPNNQPRASPSNRAASQPPMPRDTTTLDSFQHQNQPKPSSPRELQQVVEPAPHHAASWPSTPPPTDALPIGCLVKVLYAFQAQEEGELSVEANQLVMVDSENLDGWRIVLSRSDERGLVPTSYLERL